MYSEDELAEVRAALPEYLAAVHGITDLKRPFHCLNPEHPDRNPSMMYWAEAQKVKCWPCDKAWDVIDLAGWDFNATTFPEKVEAAASAVGIHLKGGPSAGRQVFTRPKGRKKPVEQKSERLYAQDLSDSVERAQSALFDSRTTDTGPARALEILHARGLDDEAIRRHHLGWVWHPGSMMPGHFDHVRGTDGGWICMPFPDDEDWSGVHYCQFRPVGKGGNGRKEEKPKDLSARIWRGYRVGGLDTVYVAEGIFDAIALEILLDVPTLAICSTSNVGLLARLAGAVPEEQRSKLVICMDNDGPGRKADGDAVERLGKAGVVYKIAHVVPERFKDANDWLLDVKGRA